MRIRRPCRAVIMRRLMTNPQVPSGRCGEAAPAEWTDVAVAMVMPATKEAVRVCAAISDDVEVYLDPLPPPSSPSNYYLLASARMLAAEVKLDTAWSAPET
jgi:hypothetical protein